MEKGDVWIVAFPDKRGREQSGKRPAIILADTTTTMALAMPLTTNLAILDDLPHTLRINKSKHNKLAKDSVALVFQLQALDKRRFVSRIGQLEKNTLRQIDTRLKQLLQL